ncbi:hypothetical protein [Mycobacterium sp.]|uniref:hypothetical protein n=1 Tax=Mycobacterium sp. TaxID=1785 RepID=UPI0025D4DAB3|nr:hypothetical protein [Mycobacterium sp.]
MSDRRLLPAAATVLAIATFVGVFVAAPLWLGYGVDVGLIVNALAAMGSISAAGAALWIATTDRQERKREHDAEDAAQARMVIISPRRPANPLELQVKIKNLGTRAIVNLRLVRITVQDHDFGNLEPTIGPFPVVASPAASNFAAGPLAGSSMFSFNPEAYGPTHPYYVAVKGGPNGELPTITSDTQLTATVRWTDASGKIWERTGSGPADASSADLSEPIQVSP